MITITELRNAAKEAGYNPDTAEELYNLKQEGEEVTEENLISFTEKWNSFCSSSSNTCWKLIDTLGYRNGWWA